MQEMDGYEFLHFLLETTKTHEIPFILSTSMSEKVHRSEAMKPGAADYIVKPFELNILLKMAQACIQCPISIKNNELHSISADLIYCAE